METKSKRTSIILLDEGDVSDVFVIPKNRDKFLITISDAVRACRAYDEQLRFLDQFEDLLATLTAWIENRRKSISSAYLTIRESDMLLVVMQKEVEFNQELNDQLTDLDLEIANNSKFDLIDLEVMSVPKVSKYSVKAFLSSGQVFSYAE